MLCARNGFLLPKTFFLPPPPPPPCPLPKKVGAKGRKFKFLTLRICKREKEKKETARDGLTPKLALKYGKQKKSFPYQSKTQRRFSFERSEYYKRLTTQENRDKQTFICLGWTFFGSESLVIKSLRRCDRKRKVSGRKEEKKDGEIVVVDADRKFYLVRLIGAFLRRYRERCFSTFQKVGHAAF